MLVCSYTSDRVSRRRLGYLPSFLLTAPHLCRTSSLHCTSTSYFFNTLISPSSTSNPTHNLLLQGSATSHKMSDRTTWSDKAHLDLLLAVLNNVTISNSDWDGKILPELRAKGYTYTLSAALYALSTWFIRPHYLPSKSSFEHHTALLTSCPAPQHLNIPLHSPPSIFPYFKRFKHFNHPIAFIMSSPTKAPTFKWDPAAERDLFAACLVAADEPKGATLAKAMEILEENFGERFTKKAATHRL